MRDFIVTHEKVNGEIELRYDIRNLCYGFIVKAEMQENELGWFIKNFPLRIEGLELLRNRSFTITEIPTDISFDAFWKKWPEIKANKVRANKIYDRMTKADKVRVLWVLDAYKRYCLRNDFKNPKYPDKWLSDKCYHNDYNAM